MHGSHCGSQQPALQTSLTALTTEEGTNGPTISIAATYYPTVDFTSFCSTSIHVPMSPFHSLHPCHQGGPGTTLAISSGLSVYMSAQCQAQPCGRSSPPCTPRANTSSCATACRKPTTHHKPPLQCAWEGTGESMPTATAAWEPETGLVSFVTCLHYHAHLQQASPILCLHAASLTPTTSLHCSVHE